MASIEFFEHPQFIRMRPKYQKWQDLHDGDPDVLRTKTYLTPHEFEYDPTCGTKIRLIREGRSYYTNVFEIVESTLTSLALKGEPVVSEEVKKLFGEYIEDVDGEGHSLISFLRESVLPNYLRFGRTWIQTDAPKEAGLSKEDEQKRGIRPVWSAWSALEVKDWKIKRAGSAKKYEIVRIEYVADKERQDLATKPEEVTRTKVFSVDAAGFTATTYEEEKSQSGKSWKQIEEAQVAIGDELPIAFVASEPWLKDVAELCLRLFNLESSLDYQLNSQGIQKIFVSGMNDDKAKMVFHETAVNFTAEGSQVTVVEPSNPVALIQRIEQTLALIFKVAFNRVQLLPQDSKESPAADAAKAAKSEQVDLVLAIIEDIENLVNEAISHWALFKNQKDFKGKICLSRDITDEDINQAILNAQAHLNYMTKIPEWIRAYLKKVAESQKLENEDIILKAIEAQDWGTDSGQSVRQGLLSKFGEKPAQQTAQQGGV